MFELGGIRSQLQDQLSDARATGSAASTQDWVDLVGSCQEVLNTVAALQTVALAHVAARDEVALEDGTVVEEFRGLGHQRLDAPALVDDLLGLSAAAATDRVATAVDLITRHPQLVDQMAAGRLDPYRAGVVAAELADADPQVCHRVDRVVLDRLRTTGGAEPAGPLRRHTRRVLERLDPELVRTLAERARGQRSLRRTAWAPGVDEWSATLPVEQSRSAWSVVDGLARSYVTQGRCPGLEAARADALMDLIHARATGQVTIQLTVPASEVARHAADPHPADPHAEPAEPSGTQDDALVPVTGFGMPGITHVRASWLASLPGAPVPTRHTRTRRAQTTKATATKDTATKDTATKDTATKDTATKDTATKDTATKDTASVVACDDLTGALSTLPLGRQMTPTSDTYRPPAWMIDFVRARDGGCRFPGCSVPARSCDLDHVSPWPAGPTHPNNLICLCRRHHRIKQRPGWTVTTRPDGVVAWVDPTGRQRITHPIDHLHTRSAEPPTRPSTPTSRTPSTPSPSSAPTAPSWSTESTGSSVPVPDLPSLLEDQITHNLERSLVAIACRTDTITTRNSRALRRGQRIHTSDTTARATVHQATHETAQRSRRTPASADADDPPF